MSLSEMSRATYKAHAQSIRANGAYHALKWIACPLERQDMTDLYLQDDDYLAIRKAFAKLEIPRTAFKLTHALHL